MHSILLDFPRMPPIQFFLWKQIFKGLSQVLSGKESVCQTLGWEDPLEMEMATHSSTLAWKIPWTEKPGRLQSIGLQRVGHDCSLPGFSVHGILQVTILEWVAMSFSRGSSQPRNPTCFFWWSFQTEIFRQFLSICIWLSLHCLVFVTKDYINHAS